MRQFRITILCKDSEAFPETSLDSIKQAYVEDVLDFEAQGFEIEVTIEKFEEVPFGPTTA